MWKKVIITGANGFTGKYLMQELDRYGFYVVGTWHSSLPENMNKFRWYQIDLLDEDACDKFVYAVKPDVIVHLAAQNSMIVAKQEPKSTIYNNVLGTVNILEAARRSTKKIRCILAGSAAVYDVTKCCNGITENMPVLPRNMYALTKFFQEQIAERYHADYGVDIICTRPFNYSGYLQEENCFLPNLCRQAGKIAEGKQEPKLNLGNLSVSRDFLDVRDVVRAYRFLMEENVPCGIYNISSGKSVRLIDIVNYLCDKTGIEIEIQTDESLVRKDDVPYICGSAKKIKMATGWKEEYSIFDTADWIYQNMREEVG